MGRFLKLLFKALLWIGGLAAIVWTVLEVFFVDRVMITHNGMAPTLIAGDEVFLWNGATVDMGDVALCEHPGQPGARVVGRVIAKPGMTVQTKRGQLIVEGTTPDYDIVDEVRFYDSVDDQHYELTYGYEKFGNTDHQFFRREDRPLHIPDTEVSRGYYLLGDNRGSGGQDSRNFGEVDPASCAGVLFMRWKPADTGGVEIDHGWLDIIH